MTASIYGIRGWQIVDEARLYPLCICQDCWTGPVSVSFNGADSCQKGFWSLNYKRLDVTSELSLYRYVQAVGVIEHRGTVYEYAKGWRSDRAVVRFIILLRQRHSQTTKKRLAQRYDCEVRTPLIGNWFECPNLEAVWRCKRWIRHQHRIDQLMPLRSDIVEHKP